MNLYNSTVAYETGQIDKEGTPRVKRARYVVSAESLVEAVTNLTKYITEDTRDSEIISISKSNIESIVDPKLTPTVYKIPK